MVLPSTEFRRIFVKLKMEGSGRAIEKVKIGSKGIDYTVDPLEEEE